MRRENWRVSMDRSTSGIAMMAAGILLAAGGGYLFMNSPVGGVNARTVAPFAALVIGIVLAVLGKSRMAAGEHEGLAAEAGLEVKSALGLTGSTRVEMEGDFGGFKVSVSRRETSHRGHSGYRRGYTEDYLFTIELPNPAGLDFYVGPDSILQTPVGFLPPKLEAGNWEWTDKLAVRGEPDGAAELFFANRNAWPLFREFFGAVGSCRLAGGKLEFEAGTGFVRGGRDGGTGALNAVAMKGLIQLAVEVARLVAALTPAGPRAE